MYLHSIYMAVDLGVKQQNKQSNIPYKTLYLLVSSVTFANRLDPDQARQNVGPDLDPICLTLRWYS